eukprot:69717_1
MTTDICRMYEFRNNLDANGTIELQCKLQKISGNKKTNNNSSLALDISHDFNILRTSINTLQFIHPTYFITILNMQCIRSLPNLTTFVSQVTLLNKKDGQYTTNIFEKILFTIELNRKMVQTEYKYQFVIKFTKIPLCLHIDKERRFMIGVKDLRNEDVIKFVFQSILMSKYGIAFPYDIMALLFDGFIFNNDLKGTDHDLSKHHGTMTVDEVLEQFPTATNKEKYLNDEVFTTIFEMTRQCFYALKPWKRKALKRANGLL